MTTLERTLLVNTLIESPVKVPLVLYTLRIYAVGLSSRSISVVSKGFNNGCDAKSNLLESALIQHLAKMLVGQIHLNYKHYHSFCFFLILNLF